MKLVTANYTVAEKGKMTGVIGLNYSGTNKATITEVLNNILNVYSVQNIERKSLESKQTLSFLDKQLPELKKQLERAINDLPEKQRTVFLMNRFEKKLTGI